MAERMETDLLTTLEAAKTWLQARLAEGAECPCCEQRAQSYRRTIHASMAAGLIKVYRESTPGQYVEISTILSHRELADFGKLAYWELVDAMPGERADGSTRVGWWRVNPHGQSFVERQVSIPKVAVVYNGVKLYHENPLVNIDDCLGRKFSYRELMNPR